MRKIRDVLRLSAAGMSKRTIAASLGVSAIAARDCIGRARRAGLSWPLPEGLTDESLEVRLHPPPAVAATLECIDGEHVGLKFRYTGVSRHLDHHQIEFWMTALVRVCRQLTGLRLLPNRVRLTHVRPRNNSELARFFGTKIEFGVVVDDLTVKSHPTPTPFRVQSRPPQGGAEWAYPCSA